MRTRLFVFCVCAAAGVLSGQCEAADPVNQPLVVHVSPQGDDGGNGASATPFATLAKAVEATRAAKPGQPKQVLVHGGNYYNTALVLGPEDFGLVIDAVGNDKPVLYGGIALKGWTPDGDRLFAATLPDQPAAAKGEAPKWSIRMLQADGMPRPRARIPEEGTLTHLTSFDVPWMSTTGGGWKRKPTKEELTTLKFKTGDINPAMEVQNAEVTVYHSWDESCVGVASIDPAAQTLTLNPPCGHPPGAFNVHKYVVWNTREGLTRPGQWYFDQAKNRVVYWPLQGQDMNKVEIVVPTTSSILRIRGSEKGPAKAIAVHGLTFSVTTVPLIAAGFAAADFEGAISLERAENCILSGLTISRIAGHGINASNSNGTVVENCEITACGAGGVYVGGSGAIITNNHIHGVGVLYPSAIGIYRGGKGNVVSHNEVHDCSYSAINYGGESNRIEDNLVYDCMKVLHDGAAIYLFGGKNCVIKHNLARDIADRGSSASAYYLDEQCEGCVVEDNIALRVGWPSHNHMSTKNTIRHNLFIVEGDAKITFPRSTAYTLEKNVVYATGSIRFENPEAVATWSKNLFFSRSGKIEGVTLADYNATGTSDGLKGDSTAGDPLMENWQKGLYRFKAGSPAEKLGIEPLDSSGIGRRVQRARRLL